MKVYLILLILLASPVAAEPWIITEDTECVGGELPVSDHITITSGARLTLQDCVLVFDDGEEEEAGGWYTQDVLEGLLLTVEEGATLEVRSVDGASGLRHASGDYAYSLLVDGELIMQGTPEHPVTVTGLEGYFLEASTKGGIEVHGHADLDHVAFEYNQGPFNVRDGSAELNNVSAIRNSGAFAVRNGSLAIYDTEVNVGNVGVIARLADLSLDNVTLHVQKVALKGIKSDVTVRDSLLSSRSRGSIELTDSDLLLETSTLLFGPAGVMHKHDEDHPGINTLVVKDSILEGYGVAGSMGITVDNVDLDVQGTVLRNYTQFGVYHGTGVARLVDNDFQGVGKYHGYLTGSSGFEAHNNRFSEGVLSNLVYGTPVYLDIEDSDGPVSGANVTLPTGEVYVSDARGVVGILVSIPLDGDGAPIEDEVRFLVSSDERNQEVVYRLGDAERIPVVLDAAGPGAKGMPGISVLALGAVLLGIVLVRRRA